MKSSEPVFPSQPLRSGTERAPVATNNNFRRHGGEQGRQGRGLSGYLKSNSRSPTITMNPPKARFRLSAETIVVSQTPK